MQTFYPGKPMLLESSSPKGRWAVFFEDDGDTGWLYACDLNEEKDGRNPIQEALHIYNVKNIRDKHLESVAEIIWSEDGEKACFLINNYPHAVVNFTEQRGYCRTNYPEPLKWKNHDFHWDDKVMDFFK